MYIYLLYIYIYIEYQQVIKFRNFDKSKSCIFCHSRRQKNSHNSRSVSNGWNQNGR